MGNKIEMHINARVVYEPNGMSAEEIEQLLKGSFASAVSSGLLTAEGAATVETWSMEVQTPGEAYLSYMRSSNRDEITEQICRALGVSITKNATSDSATSWRWKSDSGEFGTAELGCREDAARNAIETLLPRRDWVYEIENGDTHLGYFEWALIKAEQMSDEEAEIGTIERVKS